MLEFSLEAVEPFLSLLANSLGRELSRYRSLEPTWTRDARVENEPHISSRAWRMSSAAYKVTPRAFMSSRTDLTVSKPVVDCTAPSRLWEWEFTAKRTDYLESLNRRIERPLVAVATPLAEYGKRCHPAKRLRISNWSCILSREISHFLSHPHSRSLILIKGTLYA